MNSEKEPEKLILVGVATGSEEDAERSLAELASLVETAGGVSVARVIQNRDNADPKTYVGKGKLEEIRNAVEMTGADGIVTDDELSPAQMKNLEDALDVKVLDRTMLILDIFAIRASTKEGRLQVELAELKYRMTRLKGSGEAMSRLGGGIGTRGPGESKLETDRRRIRDRISTLKQSLDDVVRHRDLTRRTRTEAGIPVVALIGYTNAGKSTLLNTVAGADVLSEDKLFATLDPTTRSACLPGGETVLFTDTVGFINKLPHHLVDAFRSTLEEAKYADVIALVADASDENLEKEMAVVYETMDLLKIAGKPIITVYNKWDRVAAKEHPTRLPVRDPKAVETVRISALTGDGVETFLKAVEAALLEDKREIDTVIPFSEGWKIAKIRERGTMLSEAYEADGVHVHCRLPKSVAGQLFGEGASS